MANAVGGNVRYPNLQGLADLFRAKINDTANNTQGFGVGTGNQAGVIMPNSNPDLLTFMDSAIQETYADLRNIGDPELIIDNYILAAIPPLASPSQSVQVALSYAGYFNGFTWSPTWKLPIGLSKLLAVWERITGSNEDFHGLTAAPFGLPGVMQGQRMAMYEMREGMLWMPGCLSTIDLRIRGRITYPEFLNPANINFSTAYVPVLDSKNAIVAKMVINYAERFNPAGYNMALREEQRLMGKLKLEVVRQMQSQENQRQEWGGEAVSDFASEENWL